MEQEALLIRPLQRVDILLVLAGAEGRNHQGLRLAAGEQGRAVGARQHADLGEDRAHRRQVASVDAALMIEDVPAHHLRLGVVERLGDLFGLELGFAVRRQQRTQHLRLRGVDRGVALLLLRNRIGSPEIGLADFEHGLLDRGFVCRLEFARLLGGSLGEIDDRLDHRLERRMTGHHGLQHRLLGELLGLRFDHQHRIGRAGDDEVEDGFLHLLDRRVDLDLVLDEADARAADRTHEGHARQGKRRRGGDHRQDVGIVLHVVAEHGGDHLRVAAEIVGEQRADRPVDQTGRESLAIGQSAFALEVAARNAAGGERLLLIVDGEREEIDAGLRRLRGDDRCENRRLAPGRQHRAVGLPSDAASLENELAPAEGQLLALYVKHVFIILFLAIGCESL